MAKAPAKTEPNQNKKEETDAEYCKRVLAENGNLESNIGLSDPYWDRKQRI